jgi:hypothetical protein
MSLNNLKNQNRLREFAKDIIEELTKNPIIKYTEQEIQDSKYPTATCVFCGQKGCHRKHSMQYIHKECFDYCDKETKKFMAKELGLKVK